MQIIHVSQPSIYIACNDDFTIDDVQRAKRTAKINPAAKAVSYLRASSHRPNLTDETFSTDGLGCIRLLYWITLERPTAKPEAHWTRFSKLFYDASFEAPTTAAMRVLSNTEHAVHGEDAYLISNLRAHYPDEMDAIAALGQLAKL
ncbi:hypothetical protein [Parasphingorhabdus sp.]|uniref:hypothetical protein n=1 Tax=Parasphingorhabdus sp. TaxID=2709688 RepID=UPI0035945AE1